MKICTKLPLTDGYNILLSTSHYVLKVHGVPKMCSKYTDMAQLELQLFPISFMKQNVKMLGIFSKFFLSD